MVKILTCYIITTQIFTKLWKRLLSLVLNPLTTNVLYHIENNQLIWYLLSRFKSPKPIFAQAKTSEKKVWKTCDNWKWKYVGTLLLQPRGTKNLSVSLDKIYLSIWISRLEDTDGSSYSIMDQVKFVADHVIISNFLRAVFHKFYLVHFWMPWPFCLR